MKLKTIKNRFSYIAVIALSVSTLVFYNSCQKEISADIIKTNNLGKATATVSSKIIYTDVIPDSTVSAIGVYNLDLNNDGKYDLLIMSAYFSRNYCTLCKGTAVKSGFIYVYPNLDNEVGSYLSSSKLDQNALIDASLLWSVNLKTLDSTRVVAGCWDRNTCVTHTSVVGDWSGNPIDKYLGLKININSQIYYGWVRMNVLGASSFIVKDYAYNSTPNQSILAGQTK